MCRTQLSSLNCFEIAVRCQADVFDERIVSELLTIPVPLHSELLATGWDAADEGFGTSVGMYAMLQIST